jgi:hypothetical protein
VKIHYKGEPTAQYKRIQVSADDRVMAEMLNIGLRIQNKSVGAADFNDVISRYRALDPHLIPFEYSFHSGATLCTLATTPDTFYIYPYADGGGDALSAMEELKMLYALRKAIYHCNRLSPALTRTWIPSLSVQLAFTAIIHSS